MFEAKEISKFYGKQKVLDDLSFKIKEGEIASIVGSSGSGKTTLLRILSGLEIPETGEITFDDTENLYEDGLTNDERIGLSFLGIHDKFDFRESIENES